ncbi:aminotransferase class V-fold PLP-dependent enzyme [Congregibacter sp.]|uniref:aminotransferase class V-fold PLP-dependent enzyme n=1 Tax=Congregibacter sp. TaxID=2744308 RepID=UPI003F6AAB0D
MDQLVEHIRNSVIGANTAITTPFGVKPLVYADYTASGRSLTFVEDYIRDEVLPFYANTHTENSFSGAQTTALREQARDEIRRAVNAGQDDRVVFCGPGATAAINKLIDILQMRLPHDLDRRFDLAAQIPVDERPVVFVGPYEHHSNELPWRESVAEVVVIPLTKEGQLCENTLEEKLEEYHHRPVKIGSFSAASNVTGIRTDVLNVTGLLKDHDALAFWDYAAAAPYVPIDMNGPAAIDAVFISPHKFIGGPGTPGVLVAKQQLFTNSVPSTVGGGTVSYVRPEGHSYIEDIERREEGGTPAIGESIRAGLVFKLQQAVGTNEIERREADYLKRATDFLAKCPNIEVLGCGDVPRVSIMSLRFKHGEKDLHYGFVVALLNDLFGIQVRGGCSCAGPYGHSLLAMDRQYSRALEKEIQRGAGVLRPGWVRLNFNYFISDAEFDYLLNALALVADHGWRMLPFYEFDEETGVWRYQGQPMNLPSDLQTHDFLSSPLSDDDRESRPVPLDGQWERALDELLRTRRQERHYALALSQAAEALRWFVLPQEVSRQLGQWSSEQNQVCV